jgi:hypothetical protein
MQAIRYTLASLTRSTRLTTYRRFFAVSTTVDPMMLRQNDAEEDEYFFRMSMRHAMVSPFEIQEDPPAPVSKPPTHAPLSKDEIKWLSDHADIHARCGRQG